MKKTTKSVKKPVNNKLLQEQLDLALRDLASAQEQLAAMTARALVTSARVPKMPESYQTLRVLFVPLRGQVGAGNTPDAHICSIWQYICQQLGIRVDAAIAARLVRDTVLHNSASNMTKASSAAAAGGRLSAYHAMIQQARMLLPELTETDIALFAAKMDAALQAAKAAIAPKAKAK